MTCKLHFHRKRVVFEGSMSPNFTPVLKSQKEIDFQEFNLYIFQRHFKNSYPFVNCIENPPRGSFQ